MTNTLKKYKMSKDSIIEIGFVPWDERWIPQENKYILAADERVFILSEEANGTFHMTAIFSTYSTGMYLETINDVKACLKVFLKEK